MKVRRSIIGDEEWKAIEGYEDRYEVSNCGNVRSVDRTRLVNNGSCGICIRSDTGKQMALINHGNGYKYVTLMKDGRRKNFYVHRLVAQAFCEKREGRDYVNHINFDTGDNRSANLEWCTQKENIHHSVGHLKKTKNAAVGRSGEKYIRRNETKSGVPTFSVYIRQFGAYGTFGNLKQATTYRDSIIAAHADYFGQR